MNKKTDVRDEEYSEFHELAEQLDRGDIYDLTMILLEHLSDAEIITALDLTLSNAVKEHLAEIWIPIKGINRV